ncbi:MAG: SLBB domain-containing protein [Nitrospiraceae bacterium]|nr:SLBB domain-containing protein [Nitrospiraceae bacterium]
MSISLGTRLLIWMICSAMVLPPALLAQTLPVPLPGLGSAGASAGSPVAPSIPFGAGALGLYGLQGSPGQPIVTNPTALQPLTPTQTPCPTRPTADLSPESTIPNLNDYWPLEPRSLLPGSVEQRLRQEQEELDRKQETLRVQKERRELEYQAQVEREKQTLARRPGQAGIPGALVPMLPGQQVPSADQRAPLTVQDAEKKPFTGELLRAQDFSIEEAFAQFSILQGVKSRLKQFGYEFFDANANTFSPVQDVPVGPDYVIGPQDSLGVHIWNVPDQSFNRSYIAPVERDGMLVLPQVGAIPVGGQTFVEAEKTIRARLSTLLKRFELHVSMARIRTMKVFVVGEVVRPGAYELSALATASNALYAACGPAHSGSLRQVKIMRDGKAVAELDLYEFLMQGDRRGDVRLQGGDVVMVPPVGPVVAISGAVKRPAIYEAKPGTRLTDLLSLAGGLTPLSDRQRCHMFRLDPNVEGRQLIDVDLVLAMRSRGDEKSRIGVAGGDPILLDGDYIRIGTLPTQAVNVVSLVGAVKTPGPYEFRAGMHLRDLLTKDKLTVDAHQDRAEIVRTDPATYQTKVISFSPKALFDGSEADNLPLSRLDQVVVSTQVRPPSLVLVEGEVKRPGYLTIETGERLSSVLKRVGGFTPNSFPSGLVLVRESVKIKQQSELERYIASERQRLTAQAAGVAAGTAGLSGPAALSTGGAIAEQQVLMLRLQQLEAITSRVELGRVVVKMDSLEKLEGSEDDIILEARDMIRIPTPPQTVSIIGSVRNPSTVVHRPNLEFEDYLRQAGGMTEDANKKESYIMRANGTTEATYLAVKDVRPGDTIVIPQKIETRTPQLALWQTVASIIGSLALTAAGIAVVGR